MTLERSVIIKSVANIKYLCMLVRREALHKFDTLYYELGTATIENLMSIILGLGTYFLPVNVMSKKTRAMPRRTRNLCE